ncbi:restriction endonuclease subunit S [Alcanivorax sp. 1008]|uniref:restriction endonuclease subunit S n=1 Tax=Alcanivorax sp. 1008 TaxID=2816853 RepID=UPI001D7D6E7F|nr:restriction endonuclease subunit S [Alcanivorax sp. 1008]MCC1498121.1 restriction endonuclease subunit S [Alcanivorax sp. 1008]
MSQMRLADVSEVSTGQSAPQDPSAFGDHGLPFIRAGSLEGLVAGRPESSLERIVPEAAKKYRLKVYPKGTVVFAKSGMSSKIGRVYKLQSDCHVVSHLATVIPNDKIMPEYVLRWFQANPPSRLIDNDAYPSIKTSVIKDLMVDVPPLEEQKRIAKILDAADALRAKRRESLAQLDALLQSTFLDLFGDPAVNPKSWGESALGEVVQVEHGYAFKSEFFSESGKYIVLTPGSFFESGGYRDQGSKTKFYTSEPPSKFILPEGVILVAMTEQAPGLLGSPLVVPKGDRYLHNQRLGRLKLSDMVLEDFVFHLFNTPWVRGELQRSSTGTKVKHTSPSKIGDVVVPIPPLNHQREFGSIVKSIEKQKKKLQASLRELEELFCSLQQRAFSGEL